MSTLHVYPIQSQSWRKALDEMRRDGHRAYYPRDCSQDRRPGVYKGYALGTGKPADAIYVRKSIGLVDKGVAKQMLLTGRIRPRKRSEPVNPYAIGQTVRVGDVPCTVAGTDGEHCTLAWTMLGKQHTGILHYSLLHPG